MRQKRPIVWQIVWQSIANFKYFGVVLNGVLIGISVYLSNGILKYYQLKSYKLFYFGVK